MPSLQIEGRVAKEKGETGVAWYRHVSVGLVLLRSQLVKVEVEIPDELYAEWLKYYQTLKRVEKEDDEDKKSDKK